MIEIAEAGVGDHDQPWRQRGRQGLDRGGELPTDILGIPYISLDDGGAWKTLLARELQAAGYALDLRRLLD